MEEFKPVAGFSKYEGNGTLIRNKTTKTLAKKLKDGRYELVDDAGERVYVRAVTEEKEPEIVGDVKQKVEEVAEPVVKETVAEEISEEKEKKSAKKEKPVKETKEKPVKKEKAAKPGSEKIEYQKGDKVKFIDVKTKKEHTGTVVRARLYKGAPFLELEAKGFDKIIYRYQDKVIRA